MTPDDAFLQAILASPDDDAPRLIYADWLEERGDPRGEFIRVQCELARMTEDDPRRPELEAREKLFEGIYEGEWLSQLQDVVGPPPFCGCRRGFVEGVSIYPIDFLRNVEYIFTSAPVHHLQFRDNRRLAEAFCCPWLTRLAYLDCNSIGHELVGMPEQVIQLAGSPFLHNLRSLDLHRNALPDDAIVALAGSRSLRKLEELDLGLNQIGLRGMSALAASLPFRELRTLTLRANRLGDEGVAALARADMRCLEVLDLSENEISWSGIAALARSPLLFSIRELCLFANPIDDAAVRVLLESPYLQNLTSLNLSGTQISDSVVYLALLEYPSLARLKALHVWRTNLSVEALAALRSVFGDRVHF